MNSSPRTVLTIGHSTQPQERFISMLQKHGVTALSDVRSVPYSRMNPQFNRENLKQALKSCGISYVFLGKELGARSDDPSCYENGTVKYQRLATTAKFRAGLERIIVGSQKYRIALICAEKEPLECHRAILVARQLVSEGLGVEHILGNGDLESHQDALHRLMRALKMPQPEMFASRAELENEAYEKQEARIAYVKGDSGNKGEDNVWNMQVAR